MSNFCTISNSKLVHYYGSTYLELTIDKLCGALSIMQVHSITKIRNSVLDNISHSSHRHGVANCRETLGSALPNDRKSTSECETNHGEQLMKLRPSIFVERRDHCIKNTERVNDVLTK